MAMKRVAIALFRNDLRLHDNPLLTEACEWLPDKDAFLLPIYAFDPRQIDLTRLNDKDKSLSFKPATTWNFELPRCQSLRAKFLVETVLNLQSHLKQRHSDLLIRYGEPEMIVKDLVNFLQNKEMDVEVFLNAEHTFEERRTQNRLAKTCRLHLTQGGLSMIHPNDIPFDSCPKVFTAFRKQVEGLRDKMVRPVLDIPTFKPFPQEAHAFLSDQSVDWTSEIANLDIPFHKHSMLAYKGGEDSALERLQHYVQSKGESSPLFTYKKTRNSLNGIDDSTHFSAYLANGCLSAREIYRQVTEAEQMHGSNESSYWLIFELLWRDFFKFLFKDTGDTLFHIEGFKGNYDKPAKKHDSKGHQGRGQQFHRAEAHQDHLPQWNTNEDSFRKWAEGQTGIPFIDANMRELKETGYMSNRGRQNVASFLAGQLEVDWRWAAEHFESYLIDHDVASNTGNWAYTAGVGTDPRNRSFNILKQAKDYDPEGEYVLKFVPELRNVPVSHRHHPWTLSQDQRNKCEGLESYPSPMIQRPEWKGQIARAVGQGARTNGNSAERSSGNPHRGRGRGRHYAGSSHRP